ncbi:type I protein arginine methyltransferase [Trifolium repens]|nr:type I protein arginine methyltransferase [Trifolium repens]
MSSLDIEIHYWETFCKGAEAMKKFAESKKNAEKGDSSSKQAEKGASSSKQAEKGASSSNIAENIIIPPWVKWDRDTAWMEAYRSAILFHRKLIEGKVIVNVGCGTEILSIFCAKAGARNVYAIEASGMATEAERIVEANGLSAQYSLGNGRSRSPRTPTQEALPFAAFTSLLVEMVAKLEHVMGRLRRALHMGSNFCTIGPEL